MAEYVNIGAGGVTAVPVYIRKAGGLVAVLYLEVLKGADSIVAEPVNIKSAGDVKAVTVILEGTVDQLTYPVNIGKRWWPDGCTYGYKVVV